jgi:Peptidase family M28
MRRRLLTAGLLAAAAPLSAQTAAPRAAEAAATITSRDVAHRIGVIAADSMLGRDTPSNGLEMTAKYIADQFKSFGLAPGGEDGTWFQRYPITRRRLALDSSRIVFRAKDASATADFTRTARYLRGAIPEGSVSGPVILVGGQVTPDAVEEMPLKGKVVLYVSDFRTGIPANATQVGRAIRLAAPKAIVMLSNLDSLAFARRVPRTSPERNSVDLRLNSPVEVEVSERAISAVLKAAGVDLAPVRNATEPVARDLPGFRVQVEMRESILSKETAPNTIGILRGTDPVLRNEYLVYSAHMDHIGITPGARDSINNGADDDASGTVGVVELAEAFSRPGARPKRSILFITVSGEEKGLWGSRYFSEHPTVPLADLVADLNIDMIGRNWADTIVAIGKEHSDLGATLERVNAEYPELRMTAIDDRWPEERFYFRSDHYNFARKGVPILFFFNGVHVDYHQPSDEPSKIDAEKEARILKLLFYLGQEIGNSPNRPQWKPESRAEIVEEGVP